MSIPQVLPPLTPQLTSQVSHRTAIQVAPGRAGRRELGWSLVTVLLGPLAARNPDLALSLLACADEAVAAGRARWRRHGPWPARP